MEFLKGLLVYGAIKIALKLLVVVVLIGAALVMVGPKFDLGSLLPDLGTEEERIGRVVRVIDGDTLEVRVGLQTETVRLIGIDSPETKKPDVAVECGGGEAYELMKSLAEGERVRLVSDESQGETDSYGRQLAYVYLDGKTLEERMLAAGRAQVYV